MKRLLLLILLLPTFAYGQMTQYIIGDAGNEIATRVQYVPSDGSSIIAGYTYDIVAGATANAQAFVLKVTSAGAIAWQKTFGLPGTNNLIQDMIITQDNNIVVVGTVAGIGAVYTDNTAAILKFNSTTGALMWQNCFRDAATTAAGEFFFGVTELTDGTGRLVAVGSHNFTAAGSDGLICVFQSTGTLIYNEVYQIPDGDELEDVCTSADGASVYICGEYVGDYKDGRVFSYTPGTTTGTINWSQYFDFYLFGSLQDNFFNRIYLEGTKLCVQGSSILDYTTTGGSGQSILTLNAADGSGAQLYGIKNSGAAYANAPSFTCVTSDHVFTIQSPSAADYDPVLWTAGITTNTVITEITSLAAGTYKPPVRFTSAYVGEHNIEDIHLNPSGTGLIMAGGTNITSGYGNNDIYYVSCSTGLASLNGTCDTVHDIVAIPNTPFTSNVPAFDTIHFTPVYSTVNIGTTDFNIQSVCGDDILVSACNTVTLPDTVKVCKGDTVTLHPTVTGTDSILSYTWTTATGLSSTTILSPVLTASSSGWYHISVQSLIPDNLVVNGAFTLGNVGFTSAYTYVVSGTTALVPAGLYTITTDPALDNPFATDSFGDHTSGSGLMMAMNGASTPINVWCETITVTPNTYYDFAAWFANWSSDTANNLPIIQFEINGVLVGTILSFPHPDGLWTPFYTTWYSGTSTTASICINDQQTAASGNDFAIDDISFEPVCTATDSVYVLIKPTDTTVGHTDTAVCIGIGSLVLNAAAGFTGYTWSNGVTSATVTVTDTGTYWVHGTMACGELADTFIVTYAPPVVVSASDTVQGCVHSINFRSAPGGVEYNYLWSGPDGFASTLQNPLIQTGGPADQGVYTVTVLDNNTGCSGKATAIVTINLAPPPGLTNITPTQTIDYGSSVQLNADNAIYYWWMPDNGTISNRNINNPVVDPTQTTVYTVYGMDSMGCVDSAKIEVIVLTDSIMIPSAFTPNNDGLNDVFRPLGMKYQSLVEFSVYNRWGQRVFTTNNKEVGWDGTFNGVKQDMDVYNYLLIVALDDGTNRMYKGNVTLIR